MQIIVQITVNNALPLAGLPTRLPTQTKPVWEKNNPYPQNNTEKKTLHLYLNSQGVISLRKGINIEVM